MTSYNRGDVVLVLYPHSDLRTVKKRPALVLQAHQAQTDLPQKIIAMITSNLERTGATRIRVNKDSPQGKSMGLLTDSVIVTDNIATVLDQEIDRSIGTCALMSDVDQALRLVLGL